MQIFNFVKNFIFNGLLLMLFGVRLHCKSRKFGVCLQKLCKKTMSVTPNGSIYLGGRKGTEAGKVQRKERYRGRKGTEEGKVQRKERYRGRKDTEEGKIQRKERYRGRKDTEEGKIQRKERHRGR